VSDEYHVPVMGKQIVEHLVQNLEGAYFDGTLGGGGHAELILNALSTKALYVGIDRDIEAIETAKIRLARFKNFRTHQTTFENIKNVLEEEEIEAFDGIFLDLGVSSWQIDSKERGFSFRLGVKLDMRMDTRQSLTAEEIVNNYSFNELKRVFREFGEERAAGKIAYKIVEAREETPFVKSNELINIIDRCVNPRFATKSYARIFQALRIEVNNELKILEETLSEAIKYLAPKGRLCVITYHSLEDRIVKNFFKDLESPCTCPPTFPVCVCDKKAEIKRKKPLFILAEKDEIKRNTRSRSAKLRVAEKI